MNDLVHVAERLFNRPLLLAPEKAQIILDALAGRFGDLSAALEVDMTTPQANRISTMTARDGFSVASVTKGVAHIPIVGSLVNRGAWIGARSGMVSYEGIDAQVQEAAGNPQVKAILLDIDSPGGEATGMFNLAASIREARSVKPVIAVVNDVAASAAYGIASAATEIVASPTSMLGSIGVIMLHKDESAKMEKEGVKPTLIFAGAHKADGNPYAPLTENARANLQGMVFAIYDQFTAAVAMGRGERFSQDAARNTQARVYMGDEAVQLGLADRIASFADVLNELQSSSPRVGQPKRKGVSMNTETGAPAATNAGMTDADRNALRAEGAAAERSRIGSILRLEEAQGREAQATMIALETDMNAEQAKKVLAVSPKVEKAAAPAIAERDAAINGFGVAPKVDAVDVVRSGWSKAVSAANRSIGVKQ
jgi:signal peptide peptidase SppA